MQKIKVGILFGGKSAEHSISIRSAISLINTIDSSRYSPQPIIIDSQGGWHFLSLRDFSTKFNGDELVVFEGGKAKGEVKIFSSLFKETIDVVFPLLHGPFGEDGAIQGFLNTLGIPFVGSSVLASSVCMDKIFMKRLLRQAKIPTPNFLEAKKLSPPTFQEVVQKLGLPFFVKPANLGSSIGIHKVYSQKSYQEVILDTFSYDVRAIMEECIEGREIECSVLGNDLPKASLPGEIIPKNDFYDYAAKYIDNEGAEFIVPAELPLSVTTQIQQLAVRAFQLLNCAGMARVDFFLSKEGKIVVNEINTIPGFTQISLYPKLWEVSGIPYRNLIDRLIQLALERQQEQAQLKQVPEVSEMFTFEVNKLKPQKV